MLGSMTEQSRAVRRSPPGAPPTIADRTSNCGSVVAGVTHVGPSYTINTTTEPSNRARFKLTQGQGNTSSALLV
jgi:hypothetical protein